MLVQTQGFCPFSLERIVSSSLYLLFLRVSLYLFVCVFHPFRMVSIQFIWMVSFVFIMYHWNICVCVCQRQTFMLNARFTKFILNDNDLLEVLSFDGFFFTLHEIVWYVCMRAQVLIHMILYDDALCSVCVLTQNHIVMDKY